jgi:hypothetical protein
LRLTHVFGGAATDVFALCLGVHPGVVVFLRLEFSGFQHIFQTGYLLQQLFCRGFGAGRSGLLFDLPGVLVLFHAALLISTCG